jgi:hypothetical protein
MNNRRRRIALGVTILVLPAFGPATTTFAAAKLHIVAKQTAVGGFAIAMAAGTANAPGHLELVLTATPHQRATMSWVLVCTENSGGVG